MRAIYHKSTARPNKIGNQDATMQTILRSLTTNFIQAATRDNLLAATPTPCGR
jgi:hypothetical protein